MDSSFVGLVTDKTPGVCGSFRGPYFLSCTVVDVCREYTETVDARRVAPATDIERHGVKGEVCYTFTFYQTPNGETDTYLKFNKCPRLYFEPCLLHKCSCRRQ